MKVNVKQLRKFCLSALAAVGMDKSDSEILTETLLHADMRGVKSHGVMSLGRYIGLMQDGTMPKKLNYTVVKDNPVIAVWDGNRCCGQVLSHYAMKAAIEKAKVYGIGYVCVRSSNHFGAGAYYSLLAEKAGMIGIAASTGDPTMAPWGGTEKVIGNNPLAVSVPAKDELPMTLDMAQSVVAFGKINNMKRQGVAAIPEGWALDRNGKPTTVPSEVYSVVPSGGYKGIGLALVVDVMSGLLFGGGTGVRANPDQWGVSQSFMAIDPSAFGDADAFRASIDSRIAEFKAVPLAEGASPIMMPGEPEEKTFALQQEEADIIDEIVVDLNTLAEKLGISERL